MASDGRAHWDRIYQTKRSTEVSWYRAHLDTSLSLIEKASPDRRAAIIDVGGGESTLVDDLLARGYRDLTVLDVSATAIAATRARLAEAAPHVHWIVGDVTEVQLPEGGYDLWHDRAVFHFLTDPVSRAAYVRQVARSVRVGGHVIVGTFGPEGPLQCSGLDVVRYDATALHDMFGARFELVEHLEEVHRTPRGGDQQFVWCYCRVASDRANEVPSTST
jgi:SAM-dependent methyltransferase